MTKTWLPQEQDFSDFFELIAEETPAAGPGPSTRREAAPATETAEKEIDPDDPVPVLEADLARLALLYDVPFQYLVPSEKFLRPHQIRFFHLDQRWVRTLLDGAMSLGRNISLDYRHDTEFLSSVYARVARGVDLIRPKLQGKDEASTAQAVAATRAAGARAAVFLNRRGRSVEAQDLPPVTGFLLRSPLVRGWRGLEFKVWTGAEDPTPALRLENLSDEVLLGLYPGLIARLDILEPPESFHFGFNLEADGRRTKRLRSLADGALFPPKAPGSEVEVPFRDEGRFRVVDYKGLADRLDEALGLAGRVDSAHLALEMIQNPHLARFNGEGTPQ